MGILISGSNVFPESLVWAKNKNITSFHLKTVIVITVVRLLCLHSCSETPIMYNTNEGDEEACRQMTCTFNIYKHLYNDISHMLSQGYHNMAQSCINIGVN